MRRAPRLRAGMGYCGAKDIDTLQQTARFVKITTADEIIFGDGFESNQDFTKYKIFKIRGTISLKN